MANIILRYKIHIDINSNLEKEDDNKLELETTEVEKDMRTMFTNDGRCLEHIMLDTRSFVKTF